MENQVHGTEVKRITEILYRRLMENFATSELPLGFNDYVNILCSFVLTSVASLAEDEITDDLKKEVDKVRYSEGIREAIDEIIRRLKGFQGRTVEWSIFIEKGESNEFCN